LIHVKSESDVEKPVTAQCRKKLCCYTCCWP